MFWRSRNKQITGCMISQCCSLAFYEQTLPWTGLDSIALQHGFSTFIKSSPAIAEELVTRLAQLHAGMPVMHWPQHIEYAAAPIAYWLKSYNSSTFVVQRRVENEPLHISTSGDSICHRHNDWHALLLILQSMSCHCTDVAPIAAATELERRVRAAARAKRQEDDSLAADTGFPWGSLIVALACTVLYTQINSVISLGEQSCCSYMCHLFLYSGYHSLNSFKPLSVLD